MSCRHVQQHQRKESESQVVVSIPAAGAGYRLAARATRWLMTLRLPGETGCGGQQVTVSFGFERRSATCDDRLNLSLFEFDEAASYVNLEQATVSTNRKSV